ncbi:AraC family transcriptional regulator [Sphingobacterium sp. 1.A.4]|uniref:AraC family transcriptional regulator n=1 Tax=Sphingobacterium sp. 1.A.4 TaxID=2044603 RepID=UPI000C0BFB63|nr:AraC family transcriptional regulator [Sphingobacterium sp. 1.A.4]
MRSKYIIQSIGVQLISLDDITSAFHKHPYYQLVYILSGKGTHKINQSVFEFSKGNLFLIKPGDVHGFDSDHNVELCLINFNEEFFSETHTSKIDSLDFSKEFRQLEFILNNYSEFQGSLIGKDDSTLFHSLIKQLILETKYNRIWHKMITKNIVLLLLNLLSRNIQESFISTSKMENTNSRFLDVLDYIRHHIFDNNLLRVENLANQFNLSVGHFSRYFKQESNMSIKEYILYYKLELAKARLIYSEMTIAQIASELKFVDESHLNKLFKKNFGLTAKAYKQAAKK